MTSEALVSLSLAVLCSHLQQLQHLGSKSGWLLGPSTSTKTRQKTDWIVLLCQFSNYCLQLSVHSSYIFWWQQFESFLRVLLFIAREWNSFTKVRWSFTVVWRVPTVCWTVDWLSRSQTLDSDISDMLHTTQRSRSIMVCILSLSLMHFEQR